MQLTVLKGDITQVHADAIVNAANVRMRGGCGVDGAIHKAAGPGLDAYERWMYPHGLPGGGCPAVTPAFGLSDPYGPAAKWIIHVAGPDVRALVKNLSREADLGLPDDGPASALAWQPQDEALWLSYARSLVMAGALGARSITFPSLSTGVFAFPLHRAVPIALDALRTAADRAPSVTTCSIVACDDTTYGAYAEAVPS